MKEHELAYIERLKNENMKLAEELSRYNTRSEILAKRVQREMLERIANTPADKIINFDELANQATVNASEISDICGAILIEAKQKVDLHNQGAKKKETFFGKARS